MKSMLVIGAGDFGHHLCRHLVHMKNEVLIVDKNEDALEDLKDVVHSRLIADCTAPGALKEIGVSNFDVCFVCVGSDFKNNLIIVSTLKELGAKYVVTQIADSMLTKFLLNNGADEIIHPNSDSARQAAVKYSNEHIFDYVHLKDGYAIFEITPVKEWIGKSILSSSIREKYNVYIISIFTEDQENIFMPSPDYIISANDKLTVLAHEDAVAILLRKM